MLEPSKDPGVIYTTYGGVVSVSTQEDNPVYDGDTITVLRDLGHSVFFQTDFRLLGIDTPEIWPLKERPWGEISRDHFIDLLYETSLWWTFTGPRGGSLRVPALIMKSVEPDKYGGRWLGELWRPGDNVQIQLQMLDDGYARPYDGGRKEPYPLETLPEQPIESE